MTTDVSDRVDVYKMAERLSDLVWDVASKWTWMAQRTVGYRLVRATDAIGSTLAAGGGRWNAGDDKRLAKAGRGALSEVKHWLRRAYRRKLLTHQQLATIKAHFDELVPGYKAYLRSLATAPHDDTPSDAGPD